MGDSAPNLPDPAELFERGSALFCVISEGGAVVRANPAMVRAFAVSPRDLIGERLASLVAEPGRQPVVDAIAATLESGSMRRVSARTTGDSPREIEWELSPWGADAVIAVGQDVTERIADRRRLEALLQAIPDTLVELDSDGRCAAVHRAGPLSVEVGAPIESQLPEVFGAALRDGLEGALASGEVRECLYQGRADDGYREWWSRITPLASGGALALFRDVTAARSAERNLLANLRSIDESAQTVSHGLREPLVAMSDLVSRLAGRAPEPVHDQAVKLLERMEHRLDHMDRLLYGLRRYVRIGARWSAPEAIDLEALIARAVAKVRRKRPRVFEVSTHIDSGAGPVITVARALETCLVELVDNAVAHHDRDRCHIDLRVGYRPGRWRVEIVDDGPGIDAELLPAMFDLFVGAAGAERESDGLGLAVVRRILALCNGEVEVRTPVYDRRGTGVVLWWPEVWPRAGAVR